jgi:hypothetical protein
MGVQEFERRLERLFEGGFRKAFRSGLQPVEVARRLLRELDAARTLGVRGTVVPNHFVVAIATDDADRFDAYADVIEQELADEAREHARREGYHFLGPLTVQLVEDPAFKVGDLEIEATIVEGPGGRVGALLLPGGRRFPLAEQAVSIGRLPDSDVPVDDPKVSRHHAEIRPEPDGFRLVDLGSLNGTTVNGVPVRDHLLEDGDVIGLGSIVVTFEAS